MDPHFGNDPRSARRQVRHVSDATLVDQSLPFNPQILSTKPLPHSFNRHPPCLKSTHDLKVNRYGSNLQQRLTRPYRRSPTHGNGDFGRPNSQPPSLFVSETWPVTPAAATYLHIASPLFRTPCCEPASFDLSAIARLPPSLQLPRRAWRHLCVIPMARSLLMAPSCCHHTQSDRHSCADAFFSSLISQAPWPQPWGPFFVRRSRRLRVLNGQRPPSQFG
jgi:hypothetical protein